MKLPTKPSRTIDHVKAGAIVRRKRDCAGLTLRDVAQQMKREPIILSLLERGLMPWTQARFDEVLDIIKGIKSANSMPSKKD